MDITRALLFCCWLSRIKTESISDLLYDWLFTANQFVLAPSPLRLTTTDYFSATELLRLHFLCNILSDELMGLSLMNSLRLCQVYVSHI
jgi:hypothetical protein